MLSGKFIRSNLFVVINFIGELCKKKLAREKYAIYVIENIIGIGPVSQFYSQKDELLL
jgi:hypothetical protein